MQFQTFAAQILKDKKYRLTKPRLILLDILAKTKRPLNPYAIKKIARIALDVSTIYRILDCYKNLGLVHFVKESQGYMPCREFECCKNLHCHHQFVCKKCEEVTELHLDDSSFIKNLQRRFENLDIKNHYFEFSGLCQSCNK